MTQSIPKVIHMIWIQGEVAMYQSDHVRHAHEHMMSVLGAEWTLRIWDGEAIESFLLQHRPTLLEFYRESKFFAQKSDIARYVILHVLGGVYLDVTRTIHCKQRFELLVERVPPGGVIFPRLNEPMSDLIAWVVFEEHEHGPIKQLVNNDMIISAPQSHFWDHVFEHLQKYQHQSLFQLSQLHILNSTGPGTMSRLCLKFTDVCQSFVPDPAVFAPETAQPAGRQAWSHATEHDASKWLQVNLNGLSAALMVIVVILSVIIVVLFVRRKRQIAGTKKSIVEQKKGR